MIKALMKLRKSVYQCYNKQALIYEVYWWQHISFKKIFQNYAGKSWAGTFRRRRLGAGYFGPGQFGAGTIDLAPELFFCLFVFLQLRWFSL